MPHVPDPQREQDVAPDSPPSSDVDERTDRHDTNRTREPIDSSRRPEPDAIPDEGGAHPGTTAGDSGDH